MYKLLALAGTVLAQGDDLEVMQEGEKYYRPRSRFILAENVELDLYYENVQDFTIKLKMPMDQYVALSFGGSHVNADMIAFVTSSNAVFSGSDLFDMYSEGYKEPVIDSASEDYDWSYESRFPLIEFTARRAFDTGDAQDYVLQVDEVTRMGFAIRGNAVESLTAEGVQTFGEHSRHGFFEMMVHSNQTTSYWGIYVEQAAVPQVTVGALLLSSLASLLSF